MTGANINEHKIIVHETVQEGSSCSEQCKLAFFHASYMRSNSKRKESYG